MYDQSLVLTSVSKAGGVGKTTIAVNLAYEWSLRGKTVGIIDLDQNHSIEEFVGLEPELDVSSTSAFMFDPNFAGEYNFKPVLGSNNIFLLQGHEQLEELAKTLPSRTRREYILQRVLNKYPPNFDLLIFDLPGGFDIITENVLNLCTHLLIPVHIGVKTLSVDALIQRIYRFFDELELSPPPNVLGLLPNQLVKDSAGDNEVYAALQEIALGLKLKLYSPIYFRRNFKRAALEGKSLKQIHSTNDMSQIFSLVIDDLIQGARIDG